MVRLRTLGGLSIENGTAIGGAAANRRPLALLALLAVNGARGMSRDTIVALLWPESDAEHGRNSLSQVISLLRRELAADDLLLGTSELRINPDVLACDVDRVRATHRRPRSRVGDASFTRDRFWTACFSRTHQSSSAGLIRSGRDFSTRKATRSNSWRREPSLPETMCLPSELWRQRAMSGADRFARGSRADGVAGCVGRSRWRTRALSRALRAVARRAVTRAGSDARRVRGRHPTANDAARERNPAARQIATAAAQSLSSRNQFAKQTRSRHRRGGEGQRFRSRESGSRYCCADDMGC